MRDNVSVAKVMRICASVAYFAYSLVDIREIYWIRSIIWFISGPFHKSVFLHHLLCFRCGRCGSKIAVRNIARDYATCHLQNLLLSLQRFRWPPPWSVSLRFFSLQLSISIYHRLHSLDQGVVGCIRLASKSALKSFLESAVSSYRSCFLLKTCKVMLVHRWASLVSNLYRLCRSENHGEGDHWKCPKLCIVLSTLVNSKFNWPTTRSEWEGIPSPRFTAFRRSSTGVLLFITLWVRRNKPSPAKVLLFEFLESINFEYQKANLSCMRCYSSSYKAGAFIRCAEKRSKNTTRLWMIVAN